MSLRSDRRYPDNEQRIATPVCVEKWPEANERDPAYHRKAETIPRGGGSFFIECSGACHLSGHDTLEECKAHLSETYFHLDRCGSERAESPQPMEIASDSPSREAAVPAAPS